MTSEDQPSSAVRDPAGQQLRRAREALGLSLERVAEAQHLRPSVIQDIEQGRYERIDSELFLKGYVRAYAKQVNLDADRLLATLDQELEPLREQKAREAEANPLVTIERKKRQKRRIARVLTWIVLLGVMVAGVMAYLDSRETPGPVPSVEDTEGPSSEEVDAAEEVDATSSNERDEPAADVTDPLNGAEPEVSSTDDNVIASGNSGVVPPEPAPEEAPLPVEPAPVADDNSGNAEVAEGGQDISDGESVAPTAQSPIAPDQQPEGVLASGPMDEPVAPPVPLEMAFTGDCWVQVRDANGDQLTAALKRSGDRLEVEGVPPLTVVVGAVDAVSTIRFDNKPVDMKDFRVRNNRTEFTLEL